MQVCFFCQQVCELHTYQLHIWRNCRELTSNTIERGLALWSLRHAPYYAIKATKVLLMVHRTFVKNFDFKLTKLTQESCPNVFNLNAHNGQFILLLKCNETQKASAHVSENFCMVRMTSCNDTKIDSISSLGSTMHRQRSASCNQRRWSLCGIMHWSIVEILWKHSGAV